MSDETAPSQVEESPPPPSPEVRAAVRDMVHDKFLDESIRRLERRYDGIDGAVLEDAVYEAVTILLEVSRTREVRNPRGYLTTSADNEVRHHIRHAARERLPYAPAEDEDEDAWMNDPRARDLRPTEDEAVGDAVYRFVRGVIEAWESKKLRTATLLVVEGAYLGEPLSGEELAERLSDILDEEVAPATARQLRKRGLDRLRAQLLEDENPINEND